MSRCVLGWMTRPILALICLLQIEQIDFENDHSDDDPLDLALRSLRFRSVSQTLCVVVVCRLSDVCSILCNGFRNLWLYVEIIKVGFKDVFIPIRLATLGALAHLKFSILSFFGSRSSDILATWPVHLSPTACFAFLHSSERLSCGSCLCEFSVSLRGNG